MAIPGDVSQSCCKLLQKFCMDLFLHKITLVICITLTFTCSDSSVAMHVKNFMLIRHILFTLQFSQFSVKFRYFKRQFFVQQSQGDTNQIPCYNCHDLDVRVLHCGPEICRLGVAHGNNFHMKPAMVLLTHLPWTKWSPFRRRYFQVHFREWKVLYFK